MCKIGSGNQPGDALAIGDEPALQVNARKTGHLQIGNQTRGLSEACGLQETLCGLEGGYIVPKRFDQVSERFSDEIINCAKSKLVLLYECNIIMAFEIIELYDGLFFVQ